MRRMSKKRIEMGETAWAEYQKQRTDKKNFKYRMLHPDSYVNYRMNIKKKLIEYSGGKCEKCGYDRPFPNYYDFHHKDSDKKDFSISKRSLCFEKLKVEVDKCILLCKNCHGELHYVENQKIKKRTIAKIKKNGQHI